MIPIAGLVAVCCGDTRKEIGMKTRLIPLALFALTVLISACGSDDSQPTAASGTPDSSQPAQPVNKRGAQEVSIGQPVTIVGKDGKLIVKISGTRLNQSGCDESLSPEVVQSKFVATIETGNHEQPEWLWASDFYYIDDAGKVAQNVDVVQTLGAVNPCADSRQFINVPPNSTVDGSPTLVVPRITRAIGYKLEVDGTTYRFEWKLPDNWSPPTPTATPTADTTIAPTYEEPTSTPESGPSNGGIPPEWDKNGDGLIDADAPVGDVGCDTSECLVEKNRQGAESAP